MIHIENLVKSFGENKAVKGISFDVGKGEIFGLLGPNGAGKSTTIKMMVTILKKDSGSITVNGFDIDRQQREIRESLGIIFQDPSLDDGLTARENLYFHSKLYHVPNSEINERIEKALKFMELFQRKDDLVGAFSGGMKRRLEIARGILHTPEVLFLDEPTIGLDPQTRKYIWKYLADLRESRGLTMLLTTHYMEEAEICDRIAILDHGEIIALDTPANLKRGIGCDIVTIKSPDIESVENIIKEQFNLAPTREGDSIRLEVEDGSAFLPKLIEKSSGKVTGVDIKKPTLEDVFIKLTGRRIREDEASSVDKTRGALKKGGMRR